MRSTSIALAPFASVLSRLIPGLAIGLLAVTVAYADRLTDFERRQLHEYEQCANDCQLKLDDRMFKCMPYRKDKEKTESISKPRTVCVLTGCSSN
jgi:hypothetical protein